MITWKIVFTFGIAILIGLVINDFIGNHTVILDEVIGTSMVFPLFVFIIFGLLVWQM